MYRIYPNHPQPLLDKEGSLTVNAMYRIYHNHPQPLLDKEGSLTVNAIKLRSQKHVLDHLCPKRVLDY